MAKYFSGEGGVLKICVLIKEKEGNVKKRIELHMYITLFDWYSFPLSLCIMN